MKTVMVEVPEELADEILKFTEADFERAIQVVERRRREEALKNAKASEQTPATPESV